MAFSRSAKKDQEDDSSQPTDNRPTDNKVNELQEIAGQLGSLGQLLVNSKIAPLTEKLDRMDATLKTLAEAAGSGRAAETPDGPPVADILDAMNQSIGQLRQQSDSQFQKLAELLAPAEEPEEEDAGLASSTQWQQTILGPDLTANPALAFQRQQLLTGVLEGEPGACSLAGQLLVFQSAPPERLPQLLKDIGEAYYRWQPKTTSAANAMEEALVGWLQKTCEAAGILNTIELVHPGERFDTARHTAASRGVEIIEVNGWIVLRDNGRVYTKASGAVR